MGGVTREGEAIFIKITIGDRADSVRGGGQKSGLRIQGNKSLGQDQCGRGARTDYERHGEGDLWCYKNRGRRMCFKAKDVRRGKELEKVKGEKRRLNRVAVRQ